jgi:hypothetical protein
MPPGRDGSFIELIMPLRGIITAVIEAAEARSSLVDGMSVMMCRLCEARRCIRHEGKDARG